MSIMLAGAKAARSSEWLVRGFLETLQPSCSRRRVCHMTTNLPDFPTGLPYTLRSVSHLKNLAKSKPSNVT
jgi:hypothetical protein